MNHPLRPMAVAFLLSVLGIVTHLIPHEMGVSTIGALSMLAAAYLPRWLIFLPPIATVFFVDAINGFYGVLAMSFVYLGHLAGVLVIRPILRNTTLFTVPLAALINAMMFYLVSNLTPIALEYYPATVDGWIACYINGLPFLLREVLANILFGGVAFIIVWIAGEFRAYRFATAQRH